MRKIGVQDLETGEGNKDLQGRQQFDEEVVLSLKA